MKLIFATHNQGKIKEMQALLADLAIEVMGAEEAGVYENVNEDQETFAGNALKKARYVSERTGEWAVADDSGLCIEAINGRPGVFSARWAGAGASSEQMVEHTLKQLADVPEDKRGACFESALALVANDGRHWIFTGQVRGIIPLQFRGEPRLKLPYDVIFIPNGHDKTFAEMSDLEKNSLSHRGLAFQKLKEFLNKEII